MHQLHLEILSDPARLAPTRRAIEAFCTSCGFDEAAVAQMGLCVNEALANITRHAYAGAVDRPIHLDAAFADDVLKISLRDWGCGKLPPTAHPKPDPLTPGGLGLICLRVCLDDVQYTPQSDGMLLTLTRKKASPAN